MEARLSTLKLLQCDEILSVLVRPQVRPIMLYTTINNGDLYPLEFRTWTQPDRHPMFSWIESFAGNCAEEIKDECIPSLDTDAFGSFDVMALLKKYLTNS